MPTINTSTARVVAVGKDGRTLAGLRNGQHPQSDTSYLEGYWPCADESSVVVKVIGVQLLGLINLGLILSMMAFDGVDTTPLSISVVESGREERSPRVSTRLSLGRWRMSALAWDGTAETVSRDQILGRERGQGKQYFPSLADHKQEWQP